MRNFGWWLALAGVLAPGAGSAFAAGRDLGAGWRVEWDEPDGMIDVHLEKIGIGFLTLSVDAVFLRAGDGFTPRTLRFVQTGDDRITAPRLIFDSEALENRTDRPWAGFEWLLAPGERAWFNAARSQTFDTRPFSQLFFDNPGLGGAGPTQLVCAGGQLEPGEIFRPGQAAGDLFVDVDLGDAAPVTFTLQHVPLPEPASVCAVLVLVLLRGRRSENEPRP